MWWRRLTFAAFFLLVGAAIFLGFRAPPLEVETEAVTRGALRVTIEEEGKTRVIDRFVVSAPVAGYARRIDLEPGDAVTRGQALAELSPLDASTLDPRSRAEAQARLSVEEARLREAEEIAHAASADADYATKELERLSELQKDGTVSLDQLQLAETSARRTAARQRSARFAVDVARYGVDVARTALRVYSVGQGGDDYQTIRLASPVDGQVLHVFRESEGVVQPGEPLIEVGDPDALEVEVEVLSRDAVRITPGMQVFFERWGGDLPLVGTVRVIEPGGFTKISALGVEEQRVLVICDFLSPLDMRRRLADGYRVEARFIVWESSDVLQVPSSALFRHSDGGWAVFVLDESEGRAIRREVQIGRRGGLVTELVSGVAVGELVVTHPPRGLADGSTARRRERIR